MKTIIAKTAYYQLVIDEDKQRLYIELNGFWNDDAIFTSYLKDLKKATSILSNSFDCHADFYSFKAIGKIKYLSYHQQALDLLRKFGLKHSGQIMPEDPIACQQLLKIIEQFGTPAAFGDTDLVESYLDSFTPAAA